MAHNATQWHDVTCRISTGGQPLLVRQKSPFPIEGGQWFRSFREECLSAIGRRWMPVYRMADGEFAFAVGHRPALELTPKGIARYLVWSLGIHGRGFRGTCWGEQYSREERERLLPRYSADLQEIAREGRLAVFFGRCGDTHFGQYLRPVERFLRDGAQVALTPRNYVPFFFVLGLLAGEGREEFFSQRRILVVSSLTPEECERAGAALKALGAVETRHLSISRDKSMLDTIGLDGVNGPIDVALVAAGIGSARVLCQLRPLQTLCIDAGAFIPALADPKLRPHGVFRVG